MGFFGLTGRQAVWREGIEIFKQSPIIGRGFHADRLILNTHAHNSLVHALIQTGVAGTIPFLAALLGGWVFLFRTLRQLNHLESDHKIMAIQTAGVFTFLSIRTLTESTGAFFGVDWLILAPFLLYIGMVGSSKPWKESQ
jgi:O-antigen ligase